MAQGLNYVRNAWYVASWEQELLPETPLAITILNERIVVWRTAEGAVHALEDRCVHRLAALSLGRCEGERLRCMYHGMLFDPDGKVVEIPGQSMVPPQARVRSYPVQVRDSWVWVWMGEADLADEGLIPPAVGFEDPEFLLGKGQLDYEAEAKLINDNLLDFSHLSFVHAGSFGVGMQFADQPPVIKPLPRGIRYERWIENSPAALGPDPSVVFDVWQTYDYVVPGILTMWFAPFPPGTAARLDRQAPNRADAIGFCFFTSQAVTPMTDRTARYFFSTGPLRRLGGEAERDKMVATTIMAFHEDKLVIETQQRVIDQTLKPTVMPTAHDKAVTLFNRLIARMVDAEQTGAMSSGAGVQDSFRLGQAG